MTPEAIIDEVKKSGLRGRGGAGFPTGMKWGFVPKDNPKPKYLLINADESEPGTFKDHVLLERNPHLLFEGCVIGCRAIGAKVCYIYIRGEFYHLQRQLEAEIAKARAAGYLGQNILGSGQDCEIYVHRGAGAYEAGEETALIESLEGKRAQPRIKPPFPAVVGLYGCPTVVNNVETVCNVPPIIERGAGVVRGASARRRTPARSCSASAATSSARASTRRTMGVTLRELIYDYAGGIRDDRQIKAIIPGGSSVNVLLPDKLDTQASFDALVAAGSMLGSAAIIVMDETTDMVWAAQEPDPLLQARVVRQVHAVPRRRRLALQDPRQDRARRRRDARHRPAAERVQQHRRQDAVPVRRRRDRAGRQHHPALPARVRGLHPSRASPAPRRLPQHARRWARTRRCRARHRLPRRRRSRSPTSS